MVYFIQLESVKKSSYNKRFLIKLGTFHFPLFTGGSGTIQTVVLPIRYITVKSLDLYTVSLRGIMTAVAIHLITTVIPSDVWIRTYDRYPTRIRILDHPKETVSVLNK